MNTFAEAYQRALDGEAFRIMRTAYHNQIDHNSPIAVFWRNFNYRESDPFRTTKNEERICSDAEMFYLYLKNAAPEEEYAHDVMLMKYAFEADIPLRYRSSYNEYLKDAGNLHEGRRCVFAAYVLILEEELEFSEIEAVRIMQYIVERNRLMAEVPEEWKKIYEQEDREEQEKRLKIEKRLRIMENGSPDEIADAAYAYFRGEETRQDMNKAYALAAKANHYRQTPRACAIMGVCLYNGLGVKKDTEKGTLLIRSAAEAYDPMGEYWLGNIYFNDLNDGANALKYTTLAFAHGYESAGIKLGYYYISGNAGVTDYEKAKFFLRKAVEEKNAEALFYMAVIYEGEDFEKSMNYIVQSAMQGDLRSVKLAVQEYKNGFRHKPDYDKVHDLRLIGAHLKDIESVKDLELIYKYWSFKVHDELYKEWCEKLEKLENKECELYTYRKNVNLTELLARRWRDELLGLGINYTTSEINSILSHEEHGIDVLEKHAESEYGRVMNSKADLLTDKKLLAGMFRRCGKKYRDKAVAIYKDLVKRGDIDAVYALAEMYISDKEITELPKTALKKLRKLAENTDEKALYLIAKVIRKMFPGAVGEAEYTNFTKIAENECKNFWQLRKDPNCAEILGLIYEEYHKDIGTAVVYYKAALEKGDRPLSLLRLINLYLDKSCDLYDAITAKKYAERGVKLGSPEIMVLAVRAYLEGWFGETDSDKAGMLTLKALDLISPEGEFVFAEWMANNTTYSFGSLWIAKKMTHGMESGNIRLGIQYADASMAKLYTVDKIPELTEKLYLTAAEAGHSEVYEKLAELHLCIDDPLTAIYWYCRAKESGYGECAEKIADVLKKSREKFMNSEAHERKTDETVLSMLKSVLEKADGADAKVIGFLMFDGLASVKYYGIVTAIYLAFLCGAVELLKTAGYADAIARLSEFALMDEPDAALALTYIAEAYDLEEEIPINYEPPINDQAMMDDLLNELTNIDDQNFEKIIAIIMGLSGAGCGYADYLLGRYYDCVYLKHNTRLASKYFMQGMEKGNLDCMAYIGKYTLDGTEFPKNEFAAAWYLSKAYSEGSELAGYFLELCETAPNGAMREEAIEWLENHAADKTDSEYLEILKKRRYTPTTDYKEWKSIETLVKEAERLDTESESYLSKTRWLALYGYWESIYLLSEYYKKYNYNYEQSEHSRFLTKRHRTSIFDELANYFLLGYY